MVFFLPHSAGTYQELGRWPWTAATEKNVAPWGGLSSCFGPATCCFNGAAKCLGRCMQNEGSSHILCTRTIYVTGPRFAFQLLHPAPRCWLRFALAWATCFPPAETHSNRIDARRRFFSTSIRVLIWSILVQGGTHIDHSRCRRWREFNGMVWRHESPKMIEIC